MGAEVAVSTYVKRRQTACQEPNITLDALLSDPETMYMFVEMTEDAPKNSATARPSMSSYIGREISPDKARAWAT